jgi:hypothetical protein
MKSTQPKMQLKRSFGPRIQRGQSSVEYLTVSAFAAIVLLVPDSSGNVIVVQLANAIKTYYNAFAYALSYSNTITPF